MEAALKYFPAPERKHETTDETLRRRTQIDDQLFRLSLETIVHAHLFGHMNEATVLRMIAREIRRCLI